MPHDANGNGNGAAGRIAQIIMGLFLLMASGIAAALWMDVRGLRAELQAVQTIQSTRGERIRALEERVDVLTTRTAEQGAAANRLWEDVWHLKHRAAR